MKDKELHNLPCEHGGKARNKHTKCKCMNCTSYARMIQEDGIGRALVTYSYKGKEYSYVLEASNM